MGAEQQPKVDGHHPACRRRQTIEARLQDRVVLKSDQHLDAEHEHPGLIQRLLQAIRRGRHVPVKDKRGAGGLAPPKAIFAPTQPTGRAMLSTGHGRQARSWRSAPKGKPPNGRTPSARRILRTSDAGSRRRVARVRVARINLVRTRIDSAAYELATVISPVSCVFSRRCAFIP